MKKEKEGFDQIMFDFLFNASYISLCNMWNNWLKKQTFINLNLNKILKNIKKDVTLIFSFIWWEKYNIL